MAVAPFSNGGASKADDYIGFQVAEYAASALAGYPSVTVVERSALDKILSEQELQLSGLAEASGAVKVGGLANAAQVLVGSFVSDAATKKLSITGRLVDVASGTVLGSASVTGATGANPAPLYRDFVFKLLSSVKGYGVTVAVEARVATLADDDASVSADYARALAASFAKNDAEAKKYLERVVTSERVSISSYVDAARDYSSAVKRIEGGGMYAKLVAAQMDRNAELMAQVEPLTQYRNTLKVLASRLDGYLSADAFSVKAEGEESMQLGPASAVIGLPPIRVELKAEARAGVERLFAEQDIVALSDAGISLQRQPPAGKLLSDKALAGLFDLSASADAGFSVVFLDKGGKELYRLDAAPVTAFSLGRGASSFETSGPFFLAEAAPRDGWAFRPDGKVEVQARALRDLAGLKVLPRTAAFSKRVYLPSAGETLWRSLVLHAYRKQYLKLAVDGDPCPQIKDLVIADSFFESADPDLGWVPLMPAGDTRAGYSRLTGVVYFGDSATTTIHASWSGLIIEGDSPPYDGALVPSSVLYFDAPKQRFYCWVGEERLVVTVGPSNKKSVVVHSSYGSWSEGCPSPNALVIEGGTLYVGGDDLRAFDAATGKQRWKAKPKVKALASSGGTLYAVGDDVIAFDMKSGKQKWKAVMSSEALAMGVGALYVGGDRTHALDPATGKQLWIADSDARILSLDGGVLYVGGRYDICALDARTGARLWKVGFEAKALLPGGGRLFACGDDGTYAFDARTGKQLWGAACRGSSVLALGNDTLYTGGPRGTYALDVATGRQSWKAETQASAMALAGGILFTGHHALDAATGKTRWEAYVNARAALVDGTRLYICDGGYFVGGAYISGMSVYALSLIELD